MIWFPTKNPCQNNTGQGLFDRLGNQNYSIKDSISIEYAHMGKNS